MRLGQNQIFALSAIEKHRSAVIPARVIASLERRGLITVNAPRQYEITWAGKAALHTAGAPKKHGGLK